MKPLIFLVVLLICTTAHGMFGHVAQERERRQFAEQKLAEEQHIDRQLFIVVSILSAGVVIALIVGAAMGSKTRRDHEA